MNLATSGKHLLDRLRAVLDRPSGRYRQLNGARNLGEYLSRDRPREDEELLTEPVLGDLMERLLGFPPDAYFPQLGRSGLKPDFTPHDLVAHRYVLDAKSSTQDLGAHEAQIRRYIDQRQLDYAGFDGPEAIFRIEGDRREPRRLIDFATGSGGFLVEAARRVVDLGGLDLTDPRDLDDGLASIARGLHGLEISPLPYYLTEVNLLLQVSRLLGAMRLAGSEAPPFVLGVAHADSLSARQPPDRSLEGIDAESRLDRGELMRDERFGLVPLDREKHDAFQRMREDSSFDLVIGNPPYVFETGNRILFERLRGLPAWREDYRGKSDYLYYFLQLPAEKVHGAVNAA